MGINILLTSNNGRLKQIIVTISFNNQIQVDYLILKYNKKILIGTLIQKTFNFLPHRNCIILFLLWPEASRCSSRPWLEVLIIYLSINMLSTHANMNNTSYDIQRVNIKFYLNISSVDCSIMFRRPCDVIRITDSGHQWSE